MIRSISPLIVSCLLMIPALASGAEPNFKIRMLSGSEIAADKAWVQGDRLLYERSGFAGSVRMVDVAGLVDRELEDTVARCAATLQDSLRQMQQTKAAADELRKRYPDQEARGAIDTAERERLGKELTKVQYGCADALAKQRQNSQMFDEARKKASR